MRKIQKSLFLVPAIFLILLIAVPFVSAASTIKYNAADYLQSLTDGFTSLFNGNTDGFIKGLVGSFPLIAVFMIVLGVVQFISTKTIFTGEGNHKYGVILGIGMALITVWSTGVFNWIMSLGTIALFIIFAVVIMTLIYEPFAAGKRGLKSLSDASTDLMRSRKDEFSALNDVQKITHETLNERALEQKENADLDNAVTLLNQMQKTDTDIKTGLNNILKTMTYLQGARGEGAKAGFKNTINAQLQVISGRLSSKKISLDKLQADVRDLKGKIQLEFAKNVSNRKFLVEKLMRDAGRTEGKADDATMAGLTPEFNKLDVLVSRQRQLSREVEALCNENEEHYKKLVSSITQSIENLAHDNPTSAITEIHNALQILNEDENITQKISAFNNEIGSIQNQQSALKSDIIAKLRPLGQSNGQGPRVPYVKGGGQVYHRRR